MFVFPTLSTRWLSSNTRLARGRVWSRDFQLDAFRGIQFEEHALAEQATAHVVKEQT